MRLKSPQTPGTARVKDRARGAANQQTMSTNPFEATQTKFTGVIRDRRCFPRVMIERRAQVLLTYGEPVQVTVHDLSPDGLQVRCKRAAASAIRPSGRSVSHDEAPSELRLLLTLPLRKGPVPVSLRGKLLYFALINQEMVAMGIELTAMSSASRAFLDAFIEESLEPS